MPAKTMLSPGQRAAIFAPPTDRETVERFYTLGPDPRAFQAAARRCGRPQA